MNKKVIILILLLVVYLFAINPCEAASLKDECDLYYSQQQYEHNLIFKVVAPFSFYNRSGTNYILKVTDAVPVGSKPFGDFKDFEYRGKGKFHHNP